MPGAHTLSAALLLPHWMLTAVLITRNRPARKHHLLQEAFLDPSVGCAFFPFEDTLLVSFCPALLSPAPLVVNNPAPNADDIRDVELNPWVGKSPWSRKWQPTPVDTEPGRL